MTTARGYAAGLSADERQALRAALVEQRRFRMDQLAGLDRQAPDEITDQLRVAARFALDQIAAALHRLDSGRYGACTRCGEHIPVHRLEILPMAAMCVRCARDAQGALGRPT